MPEEVSTRFCAVGEQLLLLHERVRPGGNGGEEEQCPPIVLMAPGVDGGLGPGSSTSWAVWGGADCGAEAFEGSIYAQLGMQLAADHGMLCVQLNWRDVPP